MSRNLVFSPLPSKGYVLALRALAQSEPATGRIRRGEPGASPQEIGLKLRVSAESATHDVHDTRFQPRKLSGLPQADLSKAPLALNTN